ncbi:endonuclease/exonuclease/phosphatase family protein [Jejudonia soesokkakensis]|uniref:Endonuclease/exonuclease/phosphatase family protein n=1 Tax=Jejudonia soesokkakensis TaxID=1323432 RepID=A0ABW2MS40_9FLAO
MKRLGLLGTIVYWANICVALLLLLSFVLPYLPPKTFSSITLLSLVVSPLILLNLFFAIYWCFRWKRKAFLSGVLVAFSFFHFNPFFELSSEGDASAYEHTLKILTYNVRLFNAYETNPSEDVLASFSTLVNSENPDVICIQEFYRETHLTIPEYPYQYVHFRNNEVKLGHAIYSKYPLQNTGAFDFKDSNNNTIYADVVKGSDTLRVYNLHLQSLGILPSVTYLQGGDKERIRKRMTETFKRQQTQVEAILEHAKIAPFPVILSGDFNNTPYSYTYHQLTNHYKDAYVERGNGLGTTFKFDGYPMRIDYIMTSEMLEVVTFETIKESFSDHYPLSATLGWSKKD